MVTALQREIIAALKVKPVIDPQEEIRRTVDYLKKYMIAHPFLESMVLGLSGGQDSTLTGKLAQMAVNELNQELGTNKYAFIAVRLPYGVQKDEADCQDAIKFIQPSKLVTVNIKPAVDASVRTLEEATGQAVSDYLKGNEKARERMKVQYTLAGMYRGVVLGTDHAAEAVTGFYTKFGDGACDIAPIYRLNKRQGKMLLRLLGCPEHLYLKTPTADLEEEKPQLPDEVALGVTYEEIDDFLEGKDVKEESRRKIEEWYLKTEHKRRPVLTVFDEWWQS